MGVICQGKLTVVNVGDSIATLVRKDGSWTQLNDEHTPMRIDERSRIMANGGSIIKNKVNIELSVTRAFGNLKLSSVICAEPEGQTFSLTPSDEYLILSTDGLYRSFTQEQVVRRVHELRSQNLSLGQVSEQILSECLETNGGHRPCNDNLTLLIIDL